MKNARKINKVVNCNSCDNMNFSEFIVYLSDAISTQLLEYSKVKGFIKIESKTLKLDSCQ
jgi:hypothetical protein